LVLLGSLVVLLVALMFVVALTVSMMSMMSHDNSEHSMSTMSHDNTTRQRQNPKGSQTREPSAHAA